MNTCVIYESLKPVTEMKQSNVDGLMTLEGCFGVCSKKNRNNRIYEKENYAKMVESIQDRITKEGCIVGELEHPQGLNMNLENLSHKITKIGIDEEGVITGTIQLLNTPKGKIAQAIIEGGCPLYISSRACGNVDKDGHVQLENLVTYDLVGTPGFEEARMNLKENQKFECLTESLCIITEACNKAEEEEEKAKKAEEEEEKAKKAEEEEEKAKKAEEEEEKAKKAEEEEEKAKKTKKAEEEEECDEHGECCKEDLEQKVKELETKIEMLESTNSKLEENLKNWVTNEYSPLVEEWIKNNVPSNEVNEDSIKEEMKKWIIKEYSAKVQKWIIEEYSPEVQKWIIEEYSPEVEKWLNENYKGNEEADRDKWFIESIAPKLQKWLIEEYSPEIQKWVVEQYSPEIEKWTINEFAPGIQGWITEHFAPEFKESCKSLIEENLKNDKETKLQNITEMLNMLEGLEPKKPEYNQPINENLENEPLYIQKMPNEFKPLYEMASDGVKEYINRKAQLYNFVGDESIKNFWESVDFEKNIEVTNVYEGLNAIQDERERAIRAQFRSRRKFF